MLDESLDPCLATSGTVTSEAGGRHHGALQTGRATSAGHES